MRFCAVICFLLVCLSQSFAFRSEFRTDSQHRLTFVYRAGTKEEKRGTLEKSSESKRMTVNTNAWNYDYLIIHPAFDKSEVELTYSSPLATSFLYNERKGAWKATNPDNDYWYLHFKKDNDFAFESPGNNWFYMTKGGITYGDFSSNDNLLYYFNGTLYDPSSSNSTKYVAFDTDGVRVKSYNFTDINGASRISYNDSTLMISRKGYNDLKIKSPFEVLGINPSSDSSILSPTYQSLFIGSSAIFLAIFALL